MDCTVRTGCKAVFNAGVCEPYGQVSRTETRKSGDLLAAKLGRGSVSLDHRVRGTKKKVRVVQGNGSADYKARTEPDSKGVLRAGTTKQEGRVQREPTDGLESQHGTANKEHKGGLSM